MNGSIPQVIKAGWLKKQPLAIVVELYSQLCEEDKLRQLGERRDGRLVKVSQELERRHYSFITRQ